MTQEDKELIKEFERGHRIAQLVRQPGYQDLLDIMEAEAVQAEFRLLNAPMGAHEDLIRDLLISARVTRSNLERIQLRLAAAQEVALPQTGREEYETQYNSL